MHDLITEGTCYFLLKLFDLVRVKLNNVPGLKIDQVIMVLPIRLLEPRRTTAKGMTVDRTHLFEELHRPINR